MSDTPTPPPPGEPALTPPPPPAPVSPPAAPQLPAYPEQPTPQPAPQPTQSYPGAPPTYGTPTPTTVPQPGYPPYGAPLYPTTTPRPTSGLAVTSLICGIAGVVLFWAIVPVLASIAAVITGHMALGQTKRDPGIAGRGMAIAGLILGYAMIAVSAFTLIGIIISFLFVGAFSLPFVFSR